MDFLHPVEALIPGARGQVLAALTRNTSSRTVRQLALDAGVSWSRTSELIEDLHELGLVERRQTPGGVLVRLVEQNAAARLVQRMTDLRGPCIDAMREAARRIRPAPLSLTVFGSFAHGRAGRDSDIDVVAVAPESAQSDAGSLSESLGRWVSEATAITGNPVNLIELGAGEMVPAAQKAPAWLREASQQGIVLVGQPLRELMTVDEARRQRA
ncbi:MAG: nucleotidyltransferase domain-containing protein [Nocardioidaceae bacterium]